MHKKPDPCTNGQRMITTCDCPALFPATHQLYMTSDGRPWLLQDYARMWAAVLRYYPPGICQPITKTIQENERRYQIPKEAKVALVN